MGQNYQLDTLTTSMVPGLSNCAGTASSKHSQSHSDSAAIVDNQFYVFGGKSSTSDFSEGMYVYEMDTREWSEVGYEVDPGITAVSRSDAAVVVFQGKIWYIGGRGPNGLLNDILVYDPVNFRFSTVTPAGQKPPASATHRAVVAGDKFFVFGVFALPFLSSLIRFL